MKYQYIAVDISVIFKPITGFSNEEDFNEAAEHYEVVTSDEGISSIDSEFVLFFKIPIKE